jgi:hypothetical protein
VDAAAGCGAVTADCACGSCAYARPDKVKTTRSIAANRPHPMLARDWLAVLVQIFRIIRFAFCCARYRWLALEISN